MELLKPCSIALIFTLGVCFNSGSVENAFAENKSCDGASCNDKKPVEYSCNYDARVVSQITKTVYRWQDSWQPRQIIVQKIYSEKCHANWTKAFVPDDSYIFIRERDKVKGKQPTHGLSRADGIGYFWASGKMSNGYVVNHACASLPGIPIPRLGYSYDVYCTNFN